jgi:ribonuclease D
MKNIAAFSENLSISLEVGDLPLSFFKPHNRHEIVAVDIETSGLDFKEDRIGSIQIFDGSDNVYIVRPPFVRTPNLARLMADEQVKKVFHHAMFDLRFLRFKYGFDIENIGCTKIASKIACPELSSHSLAYLIEHFFSVHLDKSPRFSNWMNVRLSKDQVDYAARDVIYLPELLRLLMVVAEARGVSEIITSSFSYVPNRVDLDIAGIGDVFVY